MPDQNEVREDPNTGQRKVWTGQMWMDVKNPNAGVPSGRTDAQDLETFKNGATGIGALASLFAPEVTAPLKVGISAIGGMMGRGAAHGMAAVSHAPQDSLAEDLGKGAVEGATQEATPAVGGRLLQGGGWLASKIGNALPDSLWGRTIPAEMIGEWLGAPRGAAGTVAAASKPVLTATGKGATAAGDWANGRTTSQLLRDAWKGLTDSPLSHDDENLGGLADYTQVKRARHRPDMMDSGPRPGGPYQAPGPGVMDGEIIPEGAPKTPPPSPQGSGGATTFGTGAPGTEFGPDLPPSLRELPRRDNVWGPGSVDQAGGPAQADFSRANLKYDPQTPTSYLREQLSSETDPAQREFLVNAINQRRKLEAATAGIK
jgi:hypothetical protein